MILTVNIIRTNIAVGSRIIPCSCNVRNEINKWRGETEVVHGERRDGSQGPPYQPRGFPSGRWNVGKPVKETDPYMAPWFIPTDASQMVDEWITERIKGVERYLMKSGRTFDDWGYGLHFSVSSTTLGCIKILSLTDLLFLVDEVTACIDRKEPVALIA